MHSNKHVGRAVFIHRRRRLSSRNGSRGDWLRSGRAESRLAGLRAGIPALGVSRPSPNRGWRSTARFQSEYPCPAARPRTGAPTAGTRSSSPQLVGVLQETHMGLRRALRSVAPGSQPGLLRDSRAVAAAPRASSSVSGAAGGVASGPRSAGSQGACPDGRGSVGAAAGAGVAGRGTRRRPWTAGRATVPACSRGMPCTGPGLPVGGTSPGPGRGTSSPEAPRPQGRKREGGGGSIPLAGLRAARGCRPPAVP